LNSGQRYYVEYWARWLRGTNLVMTRTVGQGVARASAIAVPERLGTPGARNSAYRANQGPVFSDLGQTPVVPNASEPVAVTVRVSDADGVAAVTLLHRDDEQASFQSVAMADDGAHGDGAAGDGLYGGTIPGHAAGTIVEFYIEALDAVGATTEFPPGVPADAPATVLADRAVYRVGDRVVGSSLPVYRIVLTHEVEAELNRRRSLSNHLVPGTFILNDEKIFYNIGLRFRGSPFIRGDGTGGYAWSGIRVRFPADRLLMGAMEELNLDGSGATDQHDRTAYFMERMVGASIPGLEAPWSSGTYVTMRFKAGDTEHTGTYDHIQKIDNEYLGYWWADDDEGQLHKVDDWFEFYNDSNRDNWQAAMTYYGENEERYREQFKIRSREGFDDFAPLIALCDALTSDAPDEEILSQMDVREWVAILSVRFFIDDWDTLGIQRGKNSYIYLPAQDHRWKLVPWDSDLTFSNTGAQIYPEGAFPELRDLFQRPWVRRWLHADYRYIMEEIVESGRLGAWLQAVAGTPGVGGTNLEDWCIQRVQNVRSRIPDDAGTPFEITSPPASPHMTDQSIVTFEGRAPYHADVILLNGLRIDGDLRWTDNDGLRWAYDYEVLKGSQILVFRAETRLGELVGERTIEVVGLNDPPPKIAAVSPDEGLSVGGLLVTISGLRFEDGAKVFFDATEAPLVEFVSAAEIRAETPPHAPGEVVVSVENPNGIRGSLLAFTYLPEPPPRVAYIHPDRGPVAGGTAVQIRGTYFQPGCRVTFGGIEATDVVRVSEGEIVAIAPARPAGAATVPVRVTNLDTQASEIAGFTYLPDPAPAIASVAPREGPRAGGTWVTINGSGFRAGVEVWFGSWPAVQVDRRSATEIVALAPGADGAQTWVSLYVQNADGQYDWLAQGFRYLPAGKTDATGDANGDGSLDLADAISILEYLFHGRALASREAADWNGDGKVDIADAMGIALAVTGAG
ncbi:MAG: IPT/TIG domain-containing protein, partial [Planctomycetes bacterium]|nr:IPT/TIG domain-containing protein [Planctomycetota bacterium]